MIFYYKTNPTVISQCTYEHCTFTNMTISCKQCMFINCVFSGCNVALLAYAQINKCTFGDCTMTEIWCSYVSHTTFNNCVHVTSVLLVDSHGSVRIHRDPDSTATNMLLPWEDREVMPLFLAQNGLSREAYVALRNLVDDRRKCWTRILKELAPEHKTEIRKILSPYCTHAMPLILNVELSKQED